MARANEAKKQKRTSTYAASPPLCPVFASSVRLKTKALIEKTAMPDGVKRQKAGRKKGTPDSAKRKKRGEVSPVKTLDGPEVRQRLQASSFAFDERHASSYAFRVDKRTDPDWIGTNDRIGTNAHRGLIPSIHASTWDEAEVVSRFLFALTHKAEGKPQDFESACRAVLSAMPEQVVQLHATQDFQEENAKLAEDNASLRKQVIDLKALSANILPMEGSSHNLKPSAETAQYLNKGKSARGQMSSTFYDHLTILNGEVEKVFGKIFSGEQDNNVRKQRLFFLLRHMLVSRFPNFAGSSSIAVNSITNAGVSVETAARRERELLQNILGGITDSLKQLAPPKGVHVSIIHFLPSPSPTPPTPPPTPPSVIYGSFPFLRPLSQEVVIQAPGQFYAGRCWSACSTG
jgi:hypothetical protein